MSKWRDVELKMITTKIGSGATPKGGQNTYKKEGISLVRSQNVLDFQFSHEGLVFIDEDQAAKLKNVEVFSKDILLNITGDSVARCCIVVEDALPARVNQHVAIIRSNINVADYKYIFYYLQKNKEELLSLSENGATRKALTKGMIEALNILLPPLPEQRAIAEVLSSLDDKIDLLHRQNKTLEQMAETLFRQWFVEEAQDDWEEVELGTVIKTTSGGTPSRKKMNYYENGKYHWVKSKELKRGFILETEETITEESLNRSSAKILPAKSILIAMYGATVGEYGIISKEMACNQAICCLIPNQNYPYTFLFMFVKIMKDELINMAIGSAQQNISQALIKKIKLPKLTNRIIAYHFKTDPFFERILKNQIQIRTLESLRNTLLPKLMSGKIRVSSSH